MTSKEINDGIEEVELFTKDLKFTECALSVSTTPAEEASAADTVNDRIEKVELLTKHLKLTECASSTSTAPAEEAFAAGATVTESCEADAAVTEAFAADTAVTESCEADAAVTEAFAADTAVTESCTADAAVTESCTAGAADAQASHEEASTANVIIPDNSGNYVLYKANIQKIFKAFDLDYIESRRRLADYLISEMEYIQEGIFKEACGKFDIKEADENTKVSENLRTEYKEYFEQIHHVFQHVQTVGTTHLPFENQCLIQTNLLIVRQDIIFRFRILSALMTRYLKIRQDFFDKDYCQSYLFQTRLQNTIIVVNWSLRHLMEYRKLASSLIERIQKETNHVISLPSVKEVKMTNPQ